MASVIQHDQMLDPQDDVQPNWMRDGSITDDPFFRNYQSPQSAAPSKKLHIVSITSRNLDDSLEAVDKDAYTAKPSTDSATSQAGTPNSINIAVIGAAGVGKSTLIQRAFGVRHALHSAVSSTKMSIDNTKYTISLIELKLESFDFRSDRRVEWPKHINGQVVPRVDGALILYDVMNSDSIINLPQALNALVFSGLPTILVSCKCDNPLNTRQVDIESIQAACLAEVETVKIASNVPETARLCLGSIVRSIMRTRKHSVSQDSLLAETGSLASTISSSSFDDDDDEFDLSFHSFLRGLPSPPTSGPRTPTSSSRHLDQIVIPAANTAMSLPTHSMFRRDIFDSSATGRRGGEQGDDSEATTPVAANMAKELESVLVIEGSDPQSSRRYSDDIPTLQKIEDPVFDKPQPAGIYFEDLVQRLLRQPMSKAYVNFSDTFLCLYRKFATPVELLWLILKEFDLLNEDEKTEDQLRVVGVLSKWVTTYPDDLAGVYTRHRLDLFIKQLNGKSLFAAAIRDVQNLLQSPVIKDEDACWGRVDADLLLDYENGLPIPCQGAAEELLAWKKAGGKVSAETTAEQDKETASSIQRCPSVPMSLASTDASSVSTFSKTVYNSVEDYQVEAATMVPSSIMPLTKFRYQICIDISDDNMAEEITRIDWIMFCSIRIRDLVRHVSLPLDQKEKIKSLAHVNRMISHFNHVARWVANMILMKRKAKHRAVMLEKFMTVAIRLRQLNNYNGLAAVIAGINGPAVHRLTQTRALVPTECQKQFTKLELLMSIQNSHSAYRLAWENSSLPRIPFIPLHRRDLVSAEEENRTWIGTNVINWKKFELLADVLLPIAQSQGTPYPHLEKCDVNARELILDCRLLTEEEIHSRSLQLEASSSSSGTSPDQSKKKFPWFHKSI